MVQMFSSWNLDAAGIETVSALALRGQGLRSREASENAHLD